MGSLRPVAAAAFRSSDVLDRTGGGRASKSEADGQNSSRSTGSSEVIGSKRPRPRKVMLLLAGLLLGGPGEEECPSIGSKSWASDRPTRTAFPGIVPCKSLPS